MVDGYEVRKRYSVKITNDTIITKYSDLPAWSEESRAYTSTAELQQIVENQLEVAFAQGYEERLGQPTFTKEDVYKVAKTILDNANHYDEMDEIYCFSDGLNFPFSDTVKLALAALGKVEEPVKQNCTFAKEIEVATKALQESRAKMWDHYNKDRVIKRGGDAFNTRIMRRDVAERLAIDAVEAAEKVRWQPIETALRDGTSILGSNGSWYCRCYYGYPLRKEGMGWVKDGEEYEVHPTHWTPLPEWD